MVYRLTEIVSQRKSGAHYCTVLLGSGGRSSFRLRLRTQRKKAQGFRPAPGLIARRARSCGPIFCGPVFLAQFFGPVFLA